MLLSVNGPVSIELDEHKTCLWTGTQQTTVVRVIYHISNFIFFRLSPVHRWRQM